jgi:hypothetical protein
MLSKIQEMKCQNICQQSCQFSKLHPDSWIPIFIQLVMPFVALAAIKCYCILLLGAVKKSSVVTPSNVIYLLLVWDFLIGPFIISCTFVQQFMNYFLQLWIVTLYFSFHFVWNQLFTFLHPPFFVSPFSFTTNWYLNLFTDEKHALHMVHIYVCEKIDLIDFFNIIFC